MNLISEDPQLLLEGRQETEVRRSGMAAVSQVGEESPTVASVCELG